MSTDPNRLDATFARLRAAGKKGFIAYLGGGDPDLPRSAEVALALAEAGADVLEIGVPFSDPLADGVVNQLSASRALAAGATLPGVLGMVRAIRAKSEVPVVLFTYLNPVYAMGAARFFTEASAAGADGVLFLDLPPDEAKFHEELHPAAVQAAGLRLIRLVAPTTPPDRAREIAASGGGFLYVVAREGVTGEQAELAAGLGDQLNALRAATDLPLAAGFGISTPAQARAAAEHADAVVVGSAIVRRVGEHAGQPDLARRVADFARPLIEAVKGMAE